MNLKEKSLKELKYYAKKNKIKGYSQLNKADLIKLIQKSQKVGKKKKINQNTIHKIAEKLGSIQEEENFNMGNINQLEKWVSYNANDIYELYSKSEIREKILTYQEKYFEVKDQNLVEIYRAICVKNEKEINFNEIGTWWSFEKDRAGCYYQGGVRKGEIKFILIGLINPKYIEWETGLYSFLYYGEDQWECAVMREKPIKIIKINDKKLDKEILAKT